MLCVNRDICFLVLGLQYHATPFLAESVLESLIETMMYFLRLKILSFWRITNIVSGSMIDLLLHKMS